ncbi:hypothetical protein K431DRAFT_242535, partial [Polychaeton citri CBS 116435]
MSPKPQNLGEHIYAYCHVMTKQVLYSLTQNLENNAVLRQLPDAGANQKPRALRKDQWKPFFTVTLPPAEQPDSIALRNNPFAQRRQNFQGMHAYKKLLEWRKLHETMWKPSPLLSRPYSPKELDEFEKEMNEKGGSKKQSVYDIAKRRKKLMRMKEVTNQMANSVADLAAVLLHQQEMGRIEAERRQVQTRESREKEVQRLVGLAEDGQAGQGPALEERIQTLNAQLDDAASKGSRRQLRVEKLELTRKRQAINYATQAVAFARLLANGEIQQRIEHMGRVLNAGREGAEDNLKVLAETTSETDKAILRYQIMKQYTEDFEKNWDTQLQALPNEIKDEASAFAPVKDAEPKTLELTAEALSPYLPSFPPKIYNENNLPKKGYSRALLKREAAPIYTTEGIKVEWAQPLDAEYAEQWPEDVEHTYMGYARHTAP